MVAQEALEEKVECEPYVEEFNKVIEPLLEKKLLETLNLITKKEEALNSPERKLAKKALADVVSKKRFIKNKTNITEQEYDKLQEKYKIVDQAVGIINSRDEVDHNR